MAKLFLDAARGRPTPWTPIWLNRQAGRYMPEYHQVKGKSPSLEFFKDSERAAQATLDAQRILGVDAAILFADLLPVLEPMGMHLDYLAGEGPVFSNPLRTLADVDNLRVVPAHEGTPYIGNTVRNVLSALPKEIALIGFAGAPFTLASYAIEGKGSRNYVHVKKFMYQAEDVWHRLCDKLVQQVSDYLALQIRSGVDAVQLFDTWVGNLSLHDFNHYVRPSLQKLLQSLRQIAPDVPVIYFGTGNHHLLESVAGLSPDVIAFDWRTPLGSTWSRLGLKAVQGNLDPIVLCSTPDVISEKAGAILREVGGRPGHIFNLGHGIIPETPVDNVRHLVEFVHKASGR